MNKWLLCLFLVYAIPVHANVSYIGSSTIGSNIIPEAAKAFTKKTGIGFSQIDIPGSTVGLEAVISGKAPLAGVSRPLTEHEKSHKLFYQVIGYDAIGVFVHQSNPIRKLTKDQIKGIFTGRIQNWRLLGWKEAPTACISERLTRERATIVEFQTLALDGAPYRQDVLQVDAPMDEVMRLAKTPNGISYFSIAFSVPQIRALDVDGVTPGPDAIRSGTYPFSRPLLLVTAGLPKGDVKRFVDFMLSPEGQQIVGRHFVTVGTVASQ